jgi:hypothetical protein
LKKLNFLYKVTIFNNDLIPTQKNTYNILIFKNVGDIRRHCTGNWFEGVRSIWTASRKGQESSSFR